VFLSVLLSMLVLVALGCGKAPPLTTVSGQVTFQGKPVARGEVCFASDTGFAINAAIGSDGMYEVRRSHLGGGIPPGTYKVMVAAPPAEFSESDVVTVPVPECPDIPAKYRQFSTSGLTITLDQPGCRYDIPLDD
jgi:hypothetical protein